MIHFRFHIVSIIAVFLAIAIGTVMGATFVGRGVIDRLQNRIDKVEGDANGRQRRERGARRSDRRAASGTSTSPPRTRLRARSPG